MNFPILAPNLGVLDAGREKFMRELTFPRSRVKPYWCIFDMKNHFNLSNKSTQRVQETPRTQKTQHIGEETFALF